jgi:hypothetical protein
VPHADVLVLCGSALLAAIDIAATAVSLLKLIPLKLRSVIFVEWQHFPDGIPVAHPCARSLTVMPKPDR